METSNNLALKVLRPELTTGEAQKHLPIAAAELKERTRERELAEAQATDRAAISGENAAVLKVLGDVLRKLTTEVAVLRTKLRPELFALREAYDFEGQAALLRKKTDAMEHAATEYDHIVTVKTGADQILYLDAIVNLRLAEHDEFAAAAVLSRTKSIIALGPVLECEGGNVGLIGGLTESLRAQADAAWKRYEAAKTAAHEARQKYDQMQRAIASRGIITSRNVSHTISQY